MSKRKEIEEEEEEEEACWDLGHSSVRLSPRGLQKLNQTSVQAASTGSPTSVQLHVQKQRPTMDAHGRDHEKGGNAS